MTDEDLSSCLSAAHDIADATGPAVLRYFRQAIQVENKAGSAGFDPVTQADKEAERIVRDRLGQRFPEHGIIGEEFGNRDSESSYTWIVDPIDGTRAFIMGSPLWGTLIGLLRDGAPILGLMDQPFTQERYWADGSGSYVRHASGKSRRLQTRSNVKLSEGILATTHPDLFHSDTARAAFAHVKDNARLTRFGGDCYNYVLLASGFVDVVVESDLKSYDIMPLIPIIEQAGGIITTWQGGPATDGGDIVAAGNAQLHAETLKCLNRTS